MPGGLIQLVAVGVQDEKLTRDPEITFFKSVYRPYGTFATNQLKIHSLASLISVACIQLDVQRNGDLIHQMTWEVTLLELGQDQ